MIRGTYGLTGENFLRELHHLLWMRPFKNGGRSDGGLSCRDHAAVVGVVARRLGARVARIHGLLVTIKGEEIPRAVLVTNPHTWLSIDTSAPCDLSFRITRRESCGSTWNTKCIWDGKAIDESAVPIKVASSDEELDSHISELKDQGVARAVIYRPFVSVELKKDDHAVFEELGSPLRDEIKFCTGEDIKVYLAMAEFLVQKAHGNADTFVSLDRESAWQKVLTRAEQSGNVNYEQDELGSR